METYLPDSSSEALEAPASLAAPEIPDVKPAAESSTEAPKGVEATLLDKVSDLLGQGTDSPTVVEGKAKATPATKPTDKADELDPTADTGKYDRTAQGRIRHLNDQTKELTTKIERLTPDAEVGRQILDYVESRGLKTEQLDNVLEMTALIASGRYDDALTVLAPIYQELQQRAGLVLPANLQQEVRLGYITEARARELHKAQTTAKNVVQREQVQAQTQAERDRARAEADQQSAYQQRVHKSASAVTDWERAKLATDPDWNLKQPLVAAELELQLRRLGRAKYPDDRSAVTLADQVLATVEQRLKTLAPRPMQVRTATSQAASPRSQARPRSLEDAVNQALGA
jgi:hypothetical protein